MFIREQIHFRNRVICENNQAIENPIEQGCQKAMIET